MTFSPRVLSYEDVRREAEEFLGEYHRSLSIPTPIEEIVEFDLGIDVIPIVGLKDEIKVDAFLASDLSAIFMDEYTLQFIQSRLFEHPQRQRLIERLASEFRVSEQTMEIRLEKDALIPALGEDM